MTSINESIGGTVFPADIGSDLQATSLDPAREILTGLLKQTLISELGTAWTQVATALGGRWVGTSPVENTLEIQPTAQTILETKEAFPLLCVFRRGTATFDQHTANFETMHQEWGVVWILGQADTVTKRKLFDFLQAGAKACRLTIERRGHPDYDSGNLVLLPPDLTSRGLFGTCKVMSAEFEPRVLTDKDPTEWLMLELSIETDEYADIDISGFDDADYMTVDQSVGDATGTIDDLVQIDTRYTG